MGCKTTSQTDPPPRLHLSGAKCSRPRHLKFKKSLSQKVGCTTTSQTKPSAKAAPVGCQLQSTTAKLKLGVTIPKGRLHDNVPDRPSLHQGCNLLRANWQPRHLKLKRSLSQKVGCTGDRSCQSTGSWDVSASQCSGLSELHGTAPSEYPPPCPQ